MFLSNIISIIVILAILGVCVWLIERYIPMPDIFKTAIRVVVCIGVVLWLLSWLGIWHGLALR